MRGARLIGVLAVLCAFAGTIQAAALDAACTKDTDCSCTNEYATCQNLLCKCGTGYTAVGTACKADIGTTCTTTTDCDTTTLTGTVCDTTMTSPVCKLGSAATCTNNQNDCVSNSACTSNACACTATTHTEETSTKLCKKALGQSCTASSDCAENDANSKTVCDTTVASPVCKLGEGGACSGGDATNCVSQAACPGADVCTCDATNYPADATTLLCIGKIGQSCNVAGGCPAYADCSTNCACMTGYSANGDNTACLGAYGSTCTATSECETTTNTDAVCDTAGKCNIKVGGDCSSNTDKCVANAACTGNSNTECACGTGYLTETTPELCQQDAGGSCTANTDCGGSLVCDLTLTEPKCRKTLANCVNDETNCVGNSGCTGGACTCSTGYTETSSLCVGDIDKSCDTHADCDTAANLVCDMGAATKTCKKGDGQACTADQCMTNAECSTCPTCECSAGYSYDSTSVMCISSEAGAAVLSSLMLAFCLLISVV